MKRTPRLPSIGKLAAITLPLCLRAAHALNFTTVPSPNLDLSNLGRVAVVGDFDSISIYQYKEQSQNAFSTNGSEALLGRYPDGSFGSLATSDGNIKSMCPFIMKDGTLAGIVVGGNFTSLGGVQAQGIALFNPNTSQITPLPGLSGRVSSIYCDAQSAVVYVGGAFSGANSTNAIAWVTGWTNLPFAGFNGPVTSITKGPTGNIIFGGDFNGLGNATVPQERNGQIINIGSADVQAGSTTTTSGFQDPRNIVCKDYTQQGSGQTWLLADNSAGYWDAKFDFGFNPTLLKLYNTNYEGRGTRTFRMTALPLNGIMNLTYVDRGGVQRYCDASCPLPEGNTTAQNFQLVNPVGMNEIRIDISEWYGSGGGLNGIELLQDDLYTYAVSQFNEPACTTGSLGANATSTGPWQRQPSGQSTADYLTAYINQGDVTSSSATVVFQPDIKESGNYSILMYTPGCIQDSSCSSRGIANITGVASSQGNTFATTVSQTNDYDKYDQIYSGYVDASSSSFRPQVTLQPASGQNVPLTVVAQRIGFELTGSTGGLNGLFEYNPNQATVGSDFSTSTIDKAGLSVGLGAVVNALAVVGQNVYVGGNFSSSGGSTDGLNNICSIGTNNATSLPNQGLNNAVEAMYQNGTTLYIGGNFTNTGDNTITGLAGIASFTTTDNTWRPIGAGVNGTVSTIVPISINVTAGNLRDCIAISGSFSSVNSFGQNSSFAANGVAIWIPTLNNWLHNIQNTAFALNGHLDASTLVPNGGPLYAGSVSSQVMGTADAVALAGNGSPSLLPLGITLAANSAKVSEKVSDGTTNSISGATTGLFYQDGNGINVTALGGRFSTKATDGSTANNFAVVTGDSPPKIYGLPSGVLPDSTILAMANNAATLFVGGIFSGTVGSNTINGFLIYNLGNNSLASVQPPALNGDSVVVNSVVVQPKSTQVFVGGNFTQAGSLNCPVLCMWDASTNQWMNPGTGLSGVLNEMIFASETRLVLAGNFTASGNKTTVLNYDTKSQQFSAFPGADALPGPVTSITPATSDYNQFFVSGVAADGTTFLQKFNGQTWVAVTGFGGTTKIRSLQAISTTANHAQSDLVASGSVLMMSGNINIPGFGNASAALYNGTTYQPFLLASSANGGQGSVGRVFVQNPGNFLSTSSHHLARGFVVLIALAIALGLIFLLVVIGILLERYRRRREGYAPVKQLTADQQANIGRIPPERLFGSINEKGSPAPRI